VRPATIAAVVALALARGAVAREEAPLTLDEALAVAARASADLAIARADAESAAADWITSTSFVLPRLDLSASFGHDFVGPSSDVRLVVQNGVPTRVDETPATDEQAYAAGLRLTQTVFDWAAFRDLSRARSSALAAARQYDEATLSVAFDVTRRFYEVVRAERTLAVLERTAARSEELVARADALFAAGRVPKSETLQARVNLANDRVAVEAQRSRTGQAGNALAQALGRADGSPIAVVPPAALDGPFAAAAEPPGLEDLLRTARERRPAVAAQAALVAATDAAALGARGGWLPSVSAQASYSRRGSALFGAEGVYADPTRAYAATAELVLSWNLFEGRRTVADVRRADAQARRARAAEDRTAALVAAEVADARTAVVSLARQVALAAEALAVAEQGLALARERLDAGLATQLEVRDASLKATQAELSLVGARIDEAVARADLARAAGGPF